MLKSQCESGEGVGMWEQVWREEREGTKKIIMLVLENI